MTTHDIDALLNQYCVAARCYSIGPFFLDGVTIWKQQVRALNLVYALAEKGLIRNRFDPQNRTGPQKVAVVGGGAAGMTAAVAVTELENKVFHFEQRPVLCHLQAGCSTRWVHPHIYDWPKAGSDNPYAALPILTWQAATAAEVARTIDASYQAFRRKNNDSLILHCGATTFLDGHAIKWDNSLELPRGDRQEFDLILLAMGFGIEKDVDRGNAISYWRNDSLNQLQPGVTSEKIDSVVVSGTGDGGLIDLLRCTIEGFNQAWIIEDVFGEADASLMRDLGDLPVQWAISKHTKKVFQGWLFESFNKICQTHKARVALLVRKLLDMRRQSVSVILNGTDDVFREALSLDDASLFNSFLAFLLYRANVFTYISGRCRAQDKEVTIRYSPPGSTANRNAVVSRYTVDQVILRHGTERDRSLRAFGVNEYAIEDLKGRQRSPAAISGSLPRWPPGWWNSRRPADIPLGLKEFLPHPSQAIAATFASAISNILHDHFADAAQRDFRLTIHRVVEIGGRQFYQQIAPYRGTRVSGDPGRIFGVDVGLVGFACRTGLPVTLRKGANWNSIWALLKASTASNVRTAPEDIESLFAFPIYGPSDGNKRVSLIVYADSRSPTFFWPAEGASAASSDVLARLNRAAVGFIENCVDLSKRGIIRFARSSFQGFPCGADVADNRLASDFPGELLPVARMIDGYKESDVTTEQCLHWDCVYADSYARL